MQGSLFTRDFLLEGIKDTDAWRGLSVEDVAAVRDGVRGVFKSFPIDAAANESVTENDLIFPVLRLLGWEHILTQQSASRKGRQDVPDALLFADVDAKAAANRERSSDTRYRHGLAVVENKAWAAALDRGAPDLINQDAPSTQMLRYLTRVEIASDRRIQWGILTNGRHWRLYFQGARSRAEEFLELDLPLLAGIPGIQPELFSPPPEQHAHLLKVFVLMLRRAAFLPDAADRRSFHQLALERSREWEARVSQSLSNVVFETLYPALAKAIRDGDPGRPKALDPRYLAEIRRGTLTLLYRLLFVLYAEDRNLLPAHDPRYDDYSLIELRKSIRDRIERGDSLSARAADIYNRLKTIFRLIDEGDSGLGLPPYNGGLFDRSQHPLLDRVHLADAAMAPVIDALSRRQESDGSRRWINYRDLSVQHLGSIYERLLEYEVATAETGDIEIRLNPLARKGSGSYYTHEDLVLLIIERAVGPLVEERVAAFETRAAELARSRSPKAERLRQLAELDPATRILDLKVCDPAMGSGHFLVSLVDYLADEILEAMANAAMIVGWADDPPYRSPLAARIEDIRTRILQAAQRERWAINKEQLDDRHIVRRMILKRTIYGVDKNPMAVELAKVALWLHTFTVGAPLSFLDHHLRCGDSLYGEWVRPVEDMLAARGAMFLNPSVAQAKNAAKGMATVERLTDADVAEARTSASTFTGVEAATGPLARLMDVVHALRWLEPDKDDAKAIHAFYDGQFGDPVSLAAGLVAAKGKGAERLAGALEKAHALSREQRFMHWEVAFPGVWTDWESKAPTGGFDAVIGNPPWDRMKLQEVEWFAARRVEIAKATHSADRKKMISALKQANDPLWLDYIVAAQRAEAAARVARATGQYPLLARGDMDIYALFVERAHRLINSTGMVGLLVPSGLASDLNTSAFFRKVTSESRLSALLDFFNKRRDESNFFPDVYYRFKFCAYIAGGDSRTFPEALCGFYLRDVAEQHDPDRVFALTASDFSNVNPNTGTAPIFRNRRDATLTGSIHARIPVLVDRRSSPPKTDWPLSYTRMFDMANDSNLFRTREQLTKGGYYPVSRNHFRKGEREFLPLYEGKMVQAFDHRAADIVIVQENVFRTGQTEQTSPENYRNPEFFPNPRYFISASDCHWPDGLRWGLAFKDVTSVTNTRTMIATLIPFCAAGHTLPVLWPEKGDISKSALQTYINSAPLLCANFNSFALDFLARQKVQGNHLTWFIVEQLPVLPPERYAARIGGTPIADIIREQVLHLIYTAHDMAPFARDMGYEGAPFPWDEDDRRHRCSRLDALFFRLYGLDEDAASYILDTFPIVREQDEAAFGRYMTKELVLGYMRAFAAGDLTSKISTG